MKINLPTLLAAFLLVSVGAFLAGRISTSQTLPESAEQNNAPSSRSGFSNSSPSSHSPLTRRTARRETSPKRKITQENRYADLEAIIRSGNALERNRAWLDWIDQLPPSEFPAAVDQFRALGMTEARFGEYSMLLSAWAKTDPLTALAYATKKTSGSFATNTILSSWASSDPEAAIQWANEKHSDPPSANRFFPAIIRSIGGSDPDRATELLTSMPRSTERGEAVSAMIPHLLAQGPDAARQWIASLQEDTLRSGAALIAAEQMAAADPNGTVDWLLANQGEATRRRMDDVFHVWAGQDLEAAKNALSSVPAGETRSNALRGIIERLADSDPDAALALMSTRSGDVTDRVVEDFVWRARRTAPQTAVDQISTIADPRTRERMYIRTVNEWMARDPAAASSWLQRNPLPQQVQNRIRRVN